MNYKPLARIFGNAGIYFVAPYFASIAAGLPSVEIALWTTLIGLILSTSRELIEYGRRK